MPLLIPGSSQPLSQHTAAHAPPLAHPSPFLKTDRNRPSSQFRQRLGRTLHALPGSACILSFPHGFVPAGSHWQPPSPPRSRPRVLAGCEYSPTAHSLHVAHRQRRQLPCSWPWVSCETCRRAGNSLPPLPGMGWGRRGGRHV